MFTLGDWLWSKFFLEDPLIASKWLLSVNRNQVLIIQF